MMPLPFSKNKNRGYACTVYPLSIKISRLAVFALLLTKANAFLYLNENFTHAEYSYMLPLPCAARHSTMGCGADGGAWACRRAETEGRE